MRLYCSKPCRSKGARLNEVRKCSEAGCVGKLRAKGLCATHYNKAFGHHAKDPMRHGNPARKREADLLHAKKRRAVLAGVEREPIDRAAIFERDAWTCGICHEPVDPEATWPDKRCASLDHIVPLSKGGPHTMANLRLAHFDCNAIRGNRHAA
jgi:5-methylcytosine-specific restriction endonuclease McrA